MNVATLMERRPIWTAALTGAVFALFLFVGTVPIAVIVLSVALIVIWRGNGKDRVPE